VEDEEGARSALTKILEAYGHSVTSAEDGETALELFGSEGGFDIVLTDLTLPGMSGWDVVERIKVLSPETPVIVLSGWDINKNDENITRSGVSMVMSKPVKVRDMLAAVDGLLGKGQRGGEKR